MQTFIPKGVVRGPILPIFILERPISSGAKILYALLCNYAAQKDHCWPKQTTLALRLACSVSSVKNYLRELADEKLIAISRDGQRNSIYYMLRPVEFTEAGHLCPHSRASQAHSASLQSSAPTAYMPQPSSSAVQSDVSSMQPNVDEIQPNFDTTQPNFDTTQPNFDTTQPNFTRNEANYGCGNNLNKINKENSPLIPPNGLETHEKCLNPQKASVGGIFSLSLAEEFEKAWELYPKQEGKALARTAWLKLHESGRLPALSVILQAIERSRTSENWQREEGRFIPQFSNWLRGERWNDTPSPQALQAQQAEQQRQSVVQAYDSSLAERKEALTRRKETVRPLFDAFAAAFPEPPNMAMIFGKWMFLHQKGIAPLAHDVPSNNTLEIEEFMKAFQEKQTLAAYTSSRSAHYAHDMQMAV